MLAEGDTLLLQGTWAALDEHLEDPAVLVVDPPALVRRQAVPLGAGRQARDRACSPRWSCCSPPAPCPPRSRACSPRAAIVLLGRADASSRRYRGVSWTTVVLVGGMISLSTAMVETGAAEQLADELVGVVGDAGPLRAARSALFLLTAALGQLISNMATALIVIPIALSAAAEMDVSAEARPDGRRRLGGRRRS